MPRGVDMRHDMDGPAFGPWLIGIAAGVLRQRIETAADAGIGAEQRNRPEPPLGFLDDVANVFFLPDIAFERRAIDRGGDGFRARQIEIGNHDLGGAGAMKGLAQRAADAVGASGDNHDLAGNLHRHTPLVGNHSWKTRLLENQARTRSSTARVVAGRAQQHKTMPDRVLKAQPLPRVKDNSETIEQAAGDNRTTAPVAAATTGRHRRQSTRSSPSPDRGRPIACRSVPGKKASARSRSTATLQTPVSSDIANTRSGSWAKTGV